MNNWIDVKDKPKDHSTVLIYPNKYEDAEWSEYSQSGENIYWAVFMNGKFHAYDHKDDCYCPMDTQPTHWMPMPEPPTNQ